MGTLRFDQYGSGQSAGRPSDRRFAEWVDLSLRLAELLRAEGRRVSILGNSMGGSAALVAASRAPWMASCVAWVPGLARAAPVEDRDRGVDGAFWKQFLAAGVLDRLGAIRVPTLALLATADELQTEAERQAALAAVRPPVEVGLLVDYRHCGWTDKQAAAVVAQSVGSLVGPDSRGPFDGLSS